MASLVFARGGTIQMHPGNWGNWVITTLGLDLRQEDARLRTRTAQGAVGLTTLVESHKRLLNA